MTTGRRDRIVFIGINALFSACHLRPLAEAHQVVAVIETIRPPSLAKRIERRLFPSRLQTCARRAGASFHEVLHRDNAALHRLLRELAPDLVVVAGMGWLLDRDALAVPRLGTLNVHPALLPAYRGAEPTFWQLFDAVAESGMTVHQIDPFEDRGPIVRQQRFPVAPGTGLAEYLGPAARGRPAAAGRGRRRCARRSGSSPWRSPPQAPRGVLSACTPPILT